MLRIKGNFTVVSNEVIEDNRLSFTSKGLYAYICACHKDGKFNAEELCSFSTDGIVSVVASLEELEAYGYLGSDGSEAD